jgi:hypothetical protein
LFGRLSTVPSAISGPPEPQHNYNNYVSELKSRLQTVHHQARQNLLASKDKSKEYYDQTTGETKLKIGDKVLLYDETVRRGRSSKLSAKWIGPYVLTELEKANATITRGLKSIKVHINRLKAFY